MHGQRFALDRALTGRRRIRPSDAVSGAGATAFWRSRTRSANLALVETRTWPSSRPITSMPSPRASSQQA